MDITLERILSLIPKKENGDFVHGAKKMFAQKIGLDSGNVVSDWINERSHSYKNYLYKISAIYNVSVEWLKGETEETKKDPSAMTVEEVDEELYDLMTELRDNYALRQLLHAAKGTDAENIEAVAEMLKRFKNK